MKRLIVAILCSLYSNILLAQAPDAQLMQHLSQIKTLKANFVQTVFNHKRVVQRTTGSLEVQRPGGFRWQSQKPLRQLIVADNKQVWIYDQDLSQVTLQRMNKGIGTNPALFLSGNVNAVTQYYHVAAAPLGNAVVYTLTPKNPKNNNYRYIQLRFEGNVLAAMRLNDHLGQTTDLRLTNVRLNTSIAANRFRFQPPAGVDVIRQ